MGKVVAIDWAVVRTEFILSAIQLKDLAARHGLKPATVRKRASREDWTGARHAMSLEVTRRAGESIESRRVGEIETYCREDLALAISIRSMARDLLKNIDSPAKLREVALTVALAQKIGRLALGAATDNSTVTTMTLPATVDDFI